MNFLDHVIHLHMGLLMNMFLSIAYTDEHQYSVEPSHYYKWRCARMTLDYDCGMCLVSPQNCKGAKVGVDE